MTSQSRPLRIVYLAGAQHCGSTMLDAILGNAPGARSLGEVGGFHRYKDESECDCRQPPAACDACRAVVDALTARDDLDGFHRLSPQPLKEHRAHWMILPTRNRRRYAQLADVIFEAVADATGCTTLIDSSKNASRAAALVLESSHDVRVIHLVRDGRGYLRSKTRRAAGDPGRRPLPLRLAPWVAKNLLIGLVLRVRLRADRYTVCRYEDLVADPEAELARLGAFAGLDTDELAQAATEGGLPRRHLFEPRRMVDYRTVRLDPSRLSSRRDETANDTRYWLSGGFVSALWGYERGQRFSDRHNSAR